MSTLLAVAMLLVYCCSALKSTANPFCVITSGNSTIDLNGILPAAYNGTLVADNGVTAAEVKFAWCQTLNSTVCNVTDWTMTVEAQGAPNTCVTAFNVFTGPASSPAPSTVTFQLWGPTDGAVASVTVSCDPQGAEGKATLVGLIVNEPIYSYDISFSSVHACPVQ